MTAPITDEIGRLDWRMGEAEAVFRDRLAVRLTEMGWSAFREWSPAPLRTRERLRASSKVDICATKDEAALLIECKWCELHHGLGQLLMYREVVEMHRPPWAGEIVLVLAGPEWAWNRYVRQAADRVGVIAWHVQVMPKGSRPGTLSLNLI